MSMPENNLLNTWPDLEFADFLVEPDQFNNIYIKYTVKTFFFLSPALKHIMNQ